MILLESVKQRQQEKHEQHEQQQQPQSPQLYHKHENDYMTRTDIQRRKDLHKFNSVSYHNSMGNDWFQLFLTDMNWHDCFPYMLQGSKSSYYKWEFLFNSSKIFLIFPTFLKFLFEKIVLNISSEQLKKEFSK